MMIVQQTATAPPSIDGRARAGTPQMIAHRPAVFRGAFTPDSAAHLTPSLVPAAVPHLPPPPALPPLYAPMPASPPAIAPAPVAHGDGAPGLELEPFVATNGISIDWHRLVTPGTFVSAVLKESTAILKDAAASGACIAMENFHVPGYQVMAVACGSARRALVAVATGRRLAFFELTSAMATNISLGPTSVRALIHIAQLYIFALDEFITSF